MNFRRGELEARITEAMIKFERDFMGRGPTEAKTYVFDDLVLVRMKGVITRAEHHLASGDPTGRGRYLIKQSRTELLEKAKDIVVGLVEGETGVKVISMHTDISIKAGERIILFTLEKKIAESP